MTFTVPDLAAATYPAQAGVDAVDFAILAAANAGTGVESGLAVTAQGTPNMTVAVAAGVARSGTSRITAAGGNVTISTADATNPRHDLITVDTAGAVAVVTGTPAAITTTAEPVYPAVPAGRAALAAVYVPAAATSITSGQIIDKRVIVAVPPPQPAAYVLSVAAGTTSAVNGTTGAVDYSGTDAGAVLQSVLTGLGAAGGTVAFRAGSYAWTSTPALLPNTTGWVRLIAEPGVTITLSTTGPRFIDFGRTAAEQTFNYILVDGFTINAAALSATGSGHSIVIGTYRGGGGTLSGQDVHFDHIVIRRIRTLNVRTAADATAQHFNIWIATHVTNNTTQYRITNILVEQCEFNGGNYGVGIYGTVQSGFLVGANPDIWEDNIVIRDIYHDTGIAPTAFGSHAHVHVGSNAKGGTVWISNITGKNSWDVGIEVDNFETAYVRDCKLENYNGFGIAITNYITPVNLNAQAYYLDNITGYWSNSTGWSSDSCSLLGMVPSNDWSGAAVTFGRVIAKNIRVYRTNANIDAAGIEGDLALLKLPMIEFVLDGAQYYGSGWTHTTGTPTPTIVLTQPAARTRVTFRDVDIRLRGTFGAGSTQLQCTGFFIAGNTDLLIDNCSADMQFTNVAAASCYGVDVGAIAGSTINSGTIRKFRWSSNDTNSRGLDIENAATFLTSAPNGLLIEDCDFSGMSGGLEIKFEDTTNKLLTRARGNRWKVWPKATYTITAPATNTGTQYTDPWDGTFSITGGTVTKIEISRDNSTYYQVAAGTNAAFPMMPGDYYRITYTVAPTITVLPSK